LEVGVGEPPAFAQIHQQPVFQNPPQCLAALLLHVGFDALGRDEVISRQAQCLLGVERQGLQAQLLIRPGPQRRHQSGAQLQYPHKVVEVARLQRGVLAVVAEGQELASVVGDLLLRDAEQLAQHRQAQGGG
ncbi:MAG: hypothetical protein ACK56I_17930, partial [bacterium]